MKLVVFADLHLDTPFRWAGPELARARRAGLRRALETIAALAADDPEVGALLCAGDLYEQERFTPDTLAFLRATFADVGKPVLLAPGNHDWLGPESLYARAGWTPNVHVFAEDRLAPFELADGLTVWGAAHRAPANTDGFLDRFAVDGRGGVHLALFHGSELAGLPAQGDGKVPHAPFTAGQVPAAGLHHAFVGHFHTPRDGDRHTYPGNPEPLAFGETGERGAVVATVRPDGTVHRRRVRVASTEVHDVPVDVTGAAHSGEVRDAVAAALAGLTGIARATVSGEVAPEADVVLPDPQSVRGTLDAVVLRLGRVTVGYDLAEVGREPTVRGQFVRDVLAADLDEEDRRRVLVTGLRALDGRRDELEVR